MSASRPLTLAALLCLAAAASGQFHRLETVRVASSAAPLTIAPSRTLEVETPLVIAPGFHINTGKPSLDYLIPTKLEWTSKELKLLRVDYPAGQRRTFSFAPDKPLEVYQGQVSIRSRFQAPRGAAPGKLTLRGKLSYQPCDDTACYPPVNVPVEVGVEIVKKLKVKS